LCLFAGRVSRLGLGTGIGIGGKNAGYQIFKLERRERKIEEEEGFEVMFKPLSLRDRAKESLVQFD